jgi:hypothetical protein
MSISSLAMKSFRFSYRFHGTEWFVAIPGASMEEATDRVRALANAQYDGELSARFAGPLVRIAAWINKVSLFK